MVQVKFKNNHLRVKILSRGDAPIYLWNQLWLIGYAAVCVAFGAVCMGPQSFSGYLRLALVFV